MSRQVAILSTTRLPRFLGEDHPDEESLFAEDRLLAEALGRRGVEARRVPWRQPGAAWGNYAMVLVRSTWDYIDDLEGFQEALQDIERAGCRLVNPLKTIRWNLDKRYLATLQAAGLPVVPTIFVKPGQGGPDQRELGQEATAAMADLGRAQDGCVVKPAVGVGGFGVKRLPDGRALAQELAAGTSNGPLLVQPFLESIASEGEWSFVFGGGRFLYAALKTPKAGDFRVQVMYGASTVEQRPAAADLAAAEACLKALPVEVDLARIDMARLPDGNLGLMEAELIEPQLYFFDVPGAADLVAEAALGLLSQ